MKNEADKGKASAYLDDIKNILDNRADSDSAPYLVTLFKEKYKEYFGDTASEFTEKKRKYNDLVMDMIPTIADRIYEADDSLKMSLILARIGNYIDFGAMNHVDEQEFMSLFSDVSFSEQDEQTYESFVKGFSNLCDGQR